LDFTFVLFLCVYNALKWIKQMFEEQAGWTWQQTPVWWPRTSAGDTHFACSQLYATRIYTRAVYWRLVVSCACFKYLRDTKFV